MPRIFPIVKRVVNIISGAVNFRFTARPAIRSSWTATLRAFTQRPATRTSLVISSARVAIQNPATRVAMRIVDGLARFDQHPATRQGWAPITARIVERPASKQTFSPAILIEAVERPASKAVTKSFGGPHSSHVVTATNDLGATQAWSNPARMQGAPNDPGDHSQDADIGGSALLLITSLLRGTMVPQSQRSVVAQPIVSVHLDWYGQVTGLPVLDDLVSRLVLGYRINTSPLPAADKDEISINTGNSNFHDAQGPRSARIDNGAGAFTDALGTAVSWANIALIQPYFKASIVLGLTGAHYYADACRLRVVVGPEP